MHLSALSFKVLLIACLFWHGLIAGENLVLQTAPPSDFSLKAEVASVVPFIQDKILLLQRLPTHSQANLWCAPGGKMKPGESPSIAATRELKEETGIEVHPSSLIYLGKFYVRYPNGDFIFHLFLTQIGNPINIAICREEHQAYRLYTVGEISSLPLTPGLDECIELALRNNR